MFSVYQHWDPLKTCIVGRSWSEDFYSWITVPHVRNLFEKIARETEEDFQNLINKLQEFGVEVLRPDLPEVTFDGTRYVAPPMTPRDHVVMIGQTLYSNYPRYDFDVFYHSIKQQDWPWCNSIEEIVCLPLTAQDNIVKLHNQYLKYRFYDKCYSKIFKQVKNQGNKFKTYFDSFVNGAMTTRIGKDLYFGTSDYNQDQIKLKEKINREFPNTRNHIVNTGGHSDGTYCPVCAGLIISLNDVPTYSDTFPDWEVVYLPGQSWEKVNDFLKLKEKNKGKWWIPGFEHDQDVINTVELWLGHWTGYVEETVFDVNMLIVDPNNVIVFGYNDAVFKALQRYNITPHVIPFRHRYFWDGGIHCVTSDLDRAGTMQDYFKERN